MRRSAQRLAASCQWHSRASYRAGIVTKRACQRAIRAPRRRYYSTEHDVPQEQSLASADIIADYKKSSIFPPATHRIKDLDSNSSNDGQVVLHGYITNVRDASSKLTFADVISVDGLDSVQVKTHVANADATELRERLRAIRPLSPVAVVGQIDPRKAPPKARANVDDVRKVASVELRVEDIYPLNDFPPDIMVAAGTTIPAEQRHLQLRTDKELRDGIIFRSRVCQSIRSFLCGQHDFVDVETPLLFKSTPEGAHEFIVPTRTPGQAYALPQSPQQYKQILMASGIARYMQIAKCFRDEDLRADRQPEFTQVDIEMAFSGQNEVMEVIEMLIKRLWSELLGVDLSGSSFARITYEEAMSRYGSDKPDTRLDSHISRIDYMIPADLVSKISDLNDPVVEVMRLKVSTDPRETSEFVGSFMASPEARPYMENPAGQPGIFVYDSRKPLNGLQPFGFEAAEVLEEKLDLESGDLVVLQARPKRPFSGGSTMMGNLRIALHKAATAAELISAPSGWNFLWITFFPLFTPATADSPSASSTPSGQVDPDHLDSATPSSPISIDQLESTHHPFTAPLTAHDAELLLTNPLEARAAHYDLVLNGVELGGGSKRIHHSALQRLVLRDILKLTDERMQDFEHLLRVLRAGCPPHAGMALGLDRLVMLMLGRDSVRDVIAFPKSGRGEDLLVKAPSAIDGETWARYHLRPIGKAER